MVGPTLEQRRKEEKPEKRREEERQRIYDTCRNAIKPEDTMDRLVKLLKIAGETQVYNNLLKAISGVKRLSDTIYAKSEVPSPSEIAENLNYAISGLSGTKSETEGKA